MNRLAVVTGATGGIGIQLCRLLARNGYDLLITGRSEDRLRMLANELKALQSIEVNYLAGDLSDPEFRGRLFEMAPGTPSVLINNAGFGGNSAFPNVDVDVETRMILTHCLASMRLSRAALVPMKARGLKRDAGYVVNVASIAGFLAGKGAADYCATKAYLISFSKCLQCDARNFGVRVQALCPGFANTEFHDSETMRNSNIKQIYPEIIWQRADKVVDASLRSLRRRFRPNVVCIPTVFYKLAWFFGASSIFAPLRILFSRGAVR